VYSPWQDHTFRVSIARAIRNPSFLETSQFLTTRLLPPLPPPLPQTFLTLGNTELRPEEMLSYELGYQVLLFERLRVRVDLFYNQLEQLIDLQPVLSTVSPFLPPIPTRAQFMNVEGGEIFGGEVGFDVFIAPWLKGFLNYSYQERKGNITAMGFAPHHKGNTGLIFSFTNGFSASVVVHYLGKAKGGVIGQVDPYTLVDLRLGYRFQVFSHAMELAIQAFNLLNEGHQEFPGGDFIERRVSGTLRYRF